MKEFIISMLTRSGKVSSKRVWGSVILIMLCFCYIWCTVNSTEMVDSTDAFLILAGSLLGLDTLVQPFTSKTKE